MEALDTRRRYMWLFSDAMKSELQAEHRRQESETKPALSPSPTPFQQFVYHWRQRQGQHHRGAHSTTSTSQRLFADWEEYVEELISTLLVPSDSKPCSVTSDHGTVEEGADDFKKPQSSSDALRTLTFYTTAFHHVYVGFQREVLQEFYIGDRNLVPPRARDKVLVTYSIGGDQPALSEDQMFYL